MAVIAIGIILIFTLTLVIMKLPLQKQREASSRFDPEHNSHHGSRFCVVCLNDLTRGDKFQQLPKCDHCFHVDCIGAWFQSSGSATCPLCRTLVFDRKLAATTEIVS